MHSHNHLHLTTTGDGLGTVEGDKAALTASLMVNEDAQKAPAQTESATTEVGKRRKVGKVTKTERDMAVVLLEQLSLALPSIASSSDKVADHS